MSGTDFEFLPNAMPQTMTMTAVGAQFGANFSSNTTGCLNPPCATLTPAPPVTGQFGVQTTFNWQTTCDHLASPVGCGATSNVYTFVIRTQDDYCPAPAINIATITIVVLDQPQLPPPKLSCTEVLPNGDVTLTWVEVIDTLNTFDSYQIFFSPNINGPYTVIDSIFNISTVVYTHMGAGANTTPGYYYIRTRSGCHSNKMSAPSDTLASVVLNVTNPGAAFGIANLNWNPVAMPPYPMMSGVYEVYREYPAGNWTLIGLTTDTSYVDTITFCNQFINYRVQMVDTLEYDTGGVPSFCNTISSIDGDVFEDVTAPNAQQIDTVSVDPFTGSVIMSWPQNNSDDVQGYIIYQFTGGTWNPVDTVWGGTMTNWMDPVSDPCTASQRYRIAAFDSCWNATPMSDEHATIYTPISIDVCADAVTLNWNDYINMVPPVSDYEIWVSENMGPLTLLTTVAPGTQTYNHTGLNQGSTYSYFIHAVNGVKSSTACVASVAVNKPFPPNFAYLRAATVRNNNYVELIGHVDITAYVTEYRIMRSLTGAAGSFTQIGTVAPTAGPLLTYNDAAAQVRQNSYYYNFIVVDSCGVEVLESNTARTILLDVVPDESQVSNTLTWNDYEGWDAPPAGPSGFPTTYVLYRAVDGGVPAMVTTFGTGTGTFTDDVSPFAAGGGVFTYFIDAEEGGGNIYSFADTSRSNTVQALHPPKLPIPNAFTPDGNGYNDVFMPITTFIPSQDYLFQVYNRWGELLWQTNDKNEGWDGRINGEMAPQGAYVYKVNFVNSQGEPFEKRGTFLLKL
jgi:gliding motility-associated-like protein